MTNETKPPTTDYDFNRGVRDGKAGNAYDPMTKDPCRREQYTNGFKHARGEAD